MARNPYPRVQETSTLSADGRSWLRVVVWLPDPVYSRRGVVQLVHGMAEHIGRYDSFARFLTGLGYVVFGHDHIGHGKSVSSADELGCMPLEGGKDILVADVTRAREAALKLSRENGTLPLFLFGHSMGSFVVRACIARNAKGISGAVICGTGNQSRILSLAGRTLSRVIGAVRGETYRSRLVDSLVIGAFSSAIEDARTDSDWISTDPVVVDAYLADPLSGQAFSVGAYATLTDLTAEVVTKKSAAAVPKQLPLLFVAGAEDPVGSCGKDVEAAAELYRSQGVEDVRVVIYPNMRHEILNEPRRLDVYNDVEQWFTECMVMNAVIREREVEKPQKEESDESPKGKEPENAASEPAADQPEEAADCPKTGDASAPSTEPAGAPSAEPNGAEPDGE